jgi:class I lanthipeptide synthase
LSDAPFLPRVRHGRLVLALARWRLSDDESVLLGSVRGSERIAAVQELRERRRLPRFVTVGPSDGQLIVDLDNPVSVELMVEMITRAEETVLTELWPSPDGLRLRGPEGRFTHEFVSADPESNSG